MSEKGNKEVKQAILDMGYDINPMKGIKGQFYRENRVRDLHILCREIIEERGSEV